MWITRENSFTWVEYGGGGFLHKKIYHMNDGFITANNRINKVTLRDLKPGTVYNYRILSQLILDFQPYSVKVDETIQSEIFSFKTSNSSETEVKWVVMNDIHDHLQTITELLYRYGETGNVKDYDFVVFNGDSFSSIGSEDQTLMGTVFLL